MNGWMNECMNKWMIEWMDEWMNDRMNGWINEWMEGWMNEWMKEARKEWMNEWINEWNLMGCQNYWKLISRYMGRWRSNGAMIFCSIWQHGRPHHPQNHWHEVNKNCCLTINHAGVNSLQWYIIYQKLSNI